MFKTSGFAFKHPVSVISSKFINKFVQKCQCYYTFSDQSIPLVTVTSVVSLLTEQLCVLLSEMHTHYTLKRESLVGTLEVPHGVRQMNGVPQSGADWSATAESRVRANWSNRFPVLTNLSLYE